MAKYVEVVADYWRIVIILKIFFMINVSKNRIIKRI